MKLIPSSGLPKTITDALSKEQRECLAFATRECKVVAEPKIQTFQVSSATSGKGSIVGGGLGHGLGQWNVFGGIGGINLKQQTIHMHQTDIQLRLEATDNGEHIFLAHSVPLALTLSIDRGDTVDLYYLKGGLPKPKEGDFRADDWSLFLIKNTHTNQLVPLGPVPSFAEKQLIGWFITGTIMLLVSAGIYSSGSDPVLLVLLGAGVIAYPLWRIWQWKKDVKAAREAAAEVYKAGLNASVKSNM